MSYLTYSEYQEMGGELEQAAFSRYSFRAKSYVYANTFGRIAKMDVVPEAVKMLMFELVELIAKNDISKEQVKSESVGSWSQSYQEIALEDLERAKQELLRTYLANAEDAQGVPLLYRGC